MITIPNDFLEFVLNISSEQNCKVYILRLEESESFSYSLEFEKHPPEQEYILGMVHYKIGGKIYNSNYEFETDPKTLLLRKKAIKIKESQEKLLKDQERAKENAEWHKRFRIMKIKYGLDNYQIAAITGNKYNSVRCTTQPTKEFPRNLKLAVWISEQNNK